MDSIEGVIKSPVAADADEVPEVSITDYIFEKLKDLNLLNCDKPWMIDAHTGSKILFSQIVPDSLKIASGLTRVGFKKGDVLHFVTYEIVQLYLIQVAVWRLGGAVRGSYQTESIEEYVRQINETKAKFILVDDETAPKLLAAAKKLDWQVKFVTFGELDVPDSISVKQLLEDDGSSFPKNVKINHRNDAIFIPNTSGSTGAPKGVLHTHYNAVAFNHHPRALEHLNYDVMTPMSNFAMGCFVLALASVLRGKTIIHLGKFQREKYLSNMLKYKPGNSIMYPFVATWFARCAELKDVDLSFMKVITVGGGILDPTTADLLKKKIPHIKIVRVYAMTETLDIANTLVDTSEFGSNLYTTQNDGQTCISSGMLLPYVQAKTVDLVTGKTQGVEGRGEICVRSPYLMKGYLSRSAESGIETVTDEEGWLHTGDVGFFDSAGRIFVTDRIGFMFKYFMFMVSPAEIEAVLQEHPAVQAAGVVGVPNPPTTCLAKAFVVKKPESNISAEELCEFVKSRLPDYKHLHGGVEFLEVLPESRGNKLDRVALKKIAMGNIF